MHHHYQDIRALTDMSPKWFDEHAVPRYSDFTPQENANVYADEIALCEIRCQDCDRPFLVCFSWMKFWPPGDHAPSLEAEIRSGTLHYGDPPNVECCPAGPTMNSVMIRVVEFWRRGWYLERVPELEIALA